MISAVYLINLKGEILIYRVSRQTPTKNHIEFHPPQAYRDDVSRAAADAFRMQVRLSCLDIKMGLRALYLREFTQELQVLAAKEFRSPVQVFEKASFFHIRYNDLLRQLRVTLAASEGNLSVFQEF